jgi:hypothetical protein
MPDAAQEIGWVVLDPDGNIVDSGPVSEAQAAAWVGELIAASKTEGEQE